MEKIILERSKKPPKKRRAAVVVSPDTYTRISEIADETGMSKEALVDLLLKKALEVVEIH